MKSFAKSMLTILGTVLIADGLRKMSNVPGLSFQTTPKLVRVGSEFININDIKGIRLCEKRTNRRYVIQITLNNGNVLSPE